MEMNVQAIQARHEAFYKAMVDVFLCWKLPKDFAPDGGISFEAPGNEINWPIGTHLLTADQAKAMFQRCVPPTCFGFNDCSSNALAVCNWAEKCGKVTPNS